MSNATAANLVGSPYTFKLSDPHSSHSVILSLLESGTGRVLDVGAAKGYIAAVLRQRGFTVVGIEGDPSLAREAANHCDQLFVLDLDGPMPEIEGDFDYIIYGDILEHLKNPLEVLLKLNRKLRPGGSVIISLPNIANIYVRLQLLMGRFEYSDRGILDRTHLRFFTRKSFCDFLAAGGLSVVSLRATPIPLPMVVPARFHGRFLSLTHDVSAWFAQHWQGLFGYQFIALAKLRNAK